MYYLLLAIAIIAEIIATSLFKPLRALRSFCPEPDVYCFM